MNGRRALLPRLPLSAWLAASHGAVLVPPVVALLASGAFTEDLRAQTREDLKHQGALLAMYVRDELEHRRISQPSAPLSAIEPELRDVLRDAKVATLSGIRLVDERGVVVASSNEVLGEDLHGDAEVAAALSGQVGTLVRPRPEQSSYHPLDSESRRAGVRIFVGVPVRLDGDVVGAVIVSRTPREQLQGLYQMRPGVLAAVVVGALATVAFAGLAAWAATRSLSQLSRGVLRIADGDFTGLRDLDHPRDSHLAEVARTASSVATMAERLRDRLAYIAEFASNVSHEFKTPIATLRGTVELLADDRGEMTPGQRARFLENAERELVRLERLVSGLLSLARADEATAQAEVALGEVLASVAADRGVPLSGEAGVVLADRAQLEAIVVNLVDNARRHGGAGVGVAIEALTDDDQTGFRVVDDGRGISAANQARVFDRFFTTDRAGGGTGLGLALARAIARRHGGDVTLESRPGHTAFTVLLPRAQR